MVNQWRERRGLRRRCWATRCAVCVVTRPLVSITTCWAVRAARASFDAASLKVPSTTARTTAAVKWTCTCGASVSSAACASVERRACWSNVSVKWIREREKMYFHVGLQPEWDREIMLSVSSLTCRCALRGANQTEEDEEAARGGNGSHVHSGHPHPPAGNSLTGSTAAGDDWEAGGHAEAMQQEVFPRPTESHGKWTPQSIDFFWTI